MTDAVKWQLPAAVVMSALVLSACAPEDAAEFEEGEPAAAQQTTQEPTQAPTEEQTEDPTSEESPEPQEDADESQGSPEPLVAEVDEPVVFEECEEAEDSDEATVTWLEDVVVEEQRHEGADAETVDVSGEDVEIPGAPDVIIPERAGQAGCVIEYESAANCLAEVQISSAYIPGFTIPERTIPEVQLPDGTVLEEVVVPEEHADARTEEGSHHEEVCQIDEEVAQEGEAVSSVSRGNISRGNLSQGNTSQPNASRGNTSTEDGEFVAGTFMGGIFAGGIFVPGVFTGGEYKPGYRLEGADSTEYSEQDEVTSYTTEGDVLFDSDEYELRSEAESELDAIADDISEREGDYLIEVEGHTDDLPTSVYDDNYELSELRAESVVDWLVDNADVDEDIISAEGLGEDYPRADNDSDEGRQENRRVVITVEPADGGDSEVDYELEEAEE